MIKGFLLDLDGVIYVGDQALPGAVGAVARLRESGLPLRFITNTTRKTRRMIAARLGDLGLTVDEAEIITPAAAARDWLKRHDARPHLLVHPNLEAEFSDCGGTSAVAVVVGDAGEALTFDSLNDAFRALNGGAEFLALAANRSFKDHDGELSLDTGAFVAALEYASRRKATLLGKPARNFYAAAVAAMGISLGDAVMVGDDAEADVAGALDAGIGAALLVRTGKYHAGVESEFKPAPTAVVDDLAHAVDWILARV